MTAEIEFSLLADGRVVAHRDGGGVYEIDLNRPWCACADFQHRHKKDGSDCKHLAAARERAMHFLRRRCYNRSRKGGGA